MVPSRDPVLAWLAERVTDYGSSRKALGRPISRDTTHTDCATARSVRHAPRHSRLAILPIVLVTFCAVIMLSQSTLTPLDTSSKSSGLRSATSSSAAPGPLDYPYVVPESLYPQASNLSSTNGIGPIASTPLPGNPSGFAVVNASSGTSTTTLWYQPVTYSTSAARSIADGACGKGCSQLPLSWSSRTEIASFSSSVTAIGINSLGSELVVAATVASSTYLFNETGTSWARFGPTLSGRLGSMASSSESVAVATISGTSVEATALTASGVTIGQTTLSATGSGVTGIDGAGVALSPAGAVYQESVIWTTAGSNSIQFSSSTDGVHFSTVAFVGSFSNPSSSLIFTSVGATHLLPGGGSPGQLAFTSVSGELFALYTTNLGGTVVPAVITSGTGGTTWKGPFLQQPANGSALDPTLSVAPTGIVFADWDAPDYGTGAIEQTIYSADGLPLQSPEILPGSGGNGVNPSAGPTVSVDAFERPLVLWPSSSVGVPGAIGYTGGFLSPDQALNFVNFAVNDPLSGADFSDGEESPTFISSVSTVVNSTQADVPNPLCSAQNSTILYLYANLTHVPLAISGSTGCSTPPKPSLSASPISSDVGADSPNTYLAVYSDWVLQSLAVPVSISPLSNVSGILNGQPLTATLPTPVWDNTTVAFEPEQLEWTPTPYSPTAFQILVSSSLPSWSSLPLKEVCGESHGVDEYEFVSLSTSAYETWTNVSIDGGPVQSFAGGATSFPSPWIYDLAADQQYSWSATQTVLNEEVETISSDACNPSEDGQQIDIIPAQYGSGTDPPVTGQGTLTTTLSVVPGNPLVVANYHSSTASLSVHFNNTLPAGAKANLENASSSQSVWAYTPSNSFNQPFSQQSADGINYDLTINATSRRGSSQPPGSPNLQYGQSGIAPAETASTSCSFTLTGSTNVPGLTIPSNVYSNIGDTVAQVNWSSSQDINGFFTYSLSGSALSWTISNVTPTGSGSNWYYNLELHGLEPWASYTGTAGVSWQQGCLRNVKETQIGQSLNTLDTVALSELDAPFDSVSGMGGGASFYWQLPSVATSLWSLTQFVSGEVVLNPANSTQPILVSITSESEISLPGQAIAYGFEFNATLPDANTTYSATLFLNYSVNSALVSEWNVTSAPFTFEYQKDSSGDGLTDQEKVNGWTVTYTTDTGSIVDQAVTAAPSAFATNGLVGDYIEKEYGLDPDTVDSASSHMLDTWNLTFNLHQGSGALPAGSNFQVWYENSTYNPFATSVEYSYQQFESGTPIGANITNVSAGPLYGRTSGDGAPAAATYLWSYTALQTFVTLPGVRAAGWLRAVEGSWRGIPTLTVWGKLSWGANPLAQNTRGIGIPDGEQPDPLSPEVVQFNITAWWSDLQSSDDEAGPFLTVSSASGGAGTVYYDGYGPVEGGSNASFSGVYVVSVPVQSTSQFAYYNLSINDNYSATSKKLDHPLTAGPVSIDLLATGGTKTLTKNQRNASITGTYRVLRESEAASTFLWAPANNSTLSGVPWGLKRYTAEPDFDLIVLNVTTAATVSSVAGASGGYTYKVALSAGLNNILIPRTGFLASPLGQALLNNTNESVKIPAGAGVTFHATDWSGRSETSGSNSVGNPNYIWVFSTTSQSQNNSNSTAFGGLPQNGAVEAGYESRQVQSVIWINITSNGYGGLTSENAELKDLLGGLILNSSGNLSGNVLTVTAELGTLGLPTNVHWALANVTLNNGGAYSPPKYHTSSPSPPWWTSVGSVAWNTLSGIAEATGVTKLISVVWNPLQAAAAYIGLAATRLSSLLGLGSLANQFAHGLKVLASAMVWALDQALSYILGLIKDIFSTAIDAISAGLNAAMSSETGSFGAGSSGSVWAYLSQRGGGTLPANVTADFWFYFAPIMVGAGAITVILAVVVGIAIPFSLGIGVLVGLAVPLLVEALSGATQPPNPSSSQSSQLLSTVGSQSSLSASSLSQSDENAFDRLEPCNTTVAIQPVGHPYPSVAWDWFAFLGACIGLTTGIWGLISAAVVDGTWGQVAGYIGATLGFATLILCIIAMIQFAELPSSYNGSNGTPFQNLQATDIWLADLGVSGATLCVFGALTDEDNPDALAVAAFGAVFSVLGMALAFSELSWIHTNT